MAGISRCIKVYFAAEADVIGVAGAGVRNGFQLRSDTAEALGTGTHSGIPCFFPVSNACSVLVLPTKGLERVPKEGYVP